MGSFVGIDLGTTYSVVAHLDGDGRPRVIPNEFGRPITPSVVAFEDGAVLVGDEAKQRQAAGSQEVAAVFKRHMGDTSFVLEFAGRDYSAIDLSALVLGYLKQQAERALGKSVSEAVITVPAYFAHAQRQATIAAGERAGLRVLSIISEPTAAALAYGLRPSTQREQRVLVYDLGGGTFDVSIVAITESDLRVIATGGDHHLGGRDWDERLVNALEVRFEADFGAALVGDDYNDLLVRVEQLKHTLSARQSAEIRLQAAGHTASYTVTRAEFADLTSDLVDRTRYLTEDVLREAQQNWADIEGVLPVGGSTRMPMVRECIERMSGKPPMGGINPDEAVALGAAIQAAIEVDAANAAPTYFLPGRKRIQDIVAHSLGVVVESADGTRYINHPIIKKNSAIPATDTGQFEMRLRPDGTTRLEVFLTQGESDDPQACEYLGCYAFSDFPWLSAPTTTVDVTYAYDRNGIAQISAIERATDTPLGLKIEPLPADVPARFANPPGQQATHEPLTLYLAFDLSGSMRREPLAEAKRAAHKFVDSCDLSTTAVGLISFSDSVSVDQAATHDNSMIRKAIDRMAIGNTGLGNLGQPFDVIYERLSAVVGMRYAVVLADGVWVKAWYAAKRARRCHAAGIEIIAVGFGKVNQAFLQAIASTTDKALLTDLSRLTETFSTIARDLAAANAERSRAIQMRTAE